MTEGTKGHGHGQVPGILIDAAFEQLADRGIRTTSVRSIAHQAGSTPSLITYHFGSIAVLFEAAMHKAQDETEKLLASLTDSLAECPQTSPALSTFMIHVIETWVQHRRLVLLRREAIDAALVSEEWVRIWRAFFARVASHFGLDRVSALAIHAFFEAASVFHLPEPKDFEAKLALRELTDLLVDIMFERPVECAGYFVGLHSKADATAKRQTTAGGMQERLLDAALGIVAESGLSAVTHRAIAQAAGLSAGAVSHYFPHIDDVLLALIVRFRNQASSDTMPEEEAGTTDAFARRAHRILQKFGAAEAEPPELRATLSLVLEAVRSPELTSIAKEIGLNIGGSLVRMSGASYAGPVAVASSVLAARITSMSWLVCAAEPDPRSARHELVDMMSNRALRSS